ncbi:MAG: AAA family ATPase [Thermoanaerobaculia bacterium]
MLVVLVGPKGSGKSHIGRILERRLGVLFFHVEPLWMAYHAECAAAGRSPDVAGGIRRVHPGIRDALERNGTICVETTGASAELLDDLLSLAPPGQTLVVRLNAPLELCLERIARRDPTHQIPLSLEGIRKVYELAMAAPVSADLTLENLALGEEEIVSSLAAALARKRAGTAPVP